MILLKIVRCKLRKAVYCEAVKCCLCEKEQKREELPAPITPTICWTPKTTLSAHLPPPLCVSDSDSIYLSLSLLLPPYLISLPLSVFFLCVADSVLPLATNLFFLTLLSRWRRPDTEQGGAGFGKEKIKYKTEVCDVVCAFTCVCLFMYLGL